MAITACAGCAVIGSGASTQRARTLGFATDLGAATALGRLHLGRVETNCSPEGVCAFASIAEGVLGGATFDGIGAGLYVARADARNAAIKRVGTIKPEARARA